MTSCNVLILTWIQKNNGVVRDRFQLFGLFSICFPEPVRLHKQPVSKVPANLTGGRPTQS